MKEKFGYQLDEYGNWVVNEKEATIVRLVFDLYVNYKKSMEVIAGRLPIDTKPGVLGGNIWNRDHVRAILNDSEYAGCADASLSASSMKLPPLLSPDQFDEAQRRENGVRYPFRSASPRGRSLRPHPLAARDP